ncbi:hypothetical protein NIES970_04590 [[Synechococcus] sp. NIES-970]|uniref:DUF4168 domain-containing protein n=1 Tax=Picosynechococcus sp. NKBG15041c TaxID=1407650 RepID=UPI0003FEED1E|nr:DUF4168 domain-containing protein [Picosynechococcus sp. NKBG15041c]BAW95550.1 hypothetical protein NIES970_04590 [[Synechococcus] sp. NIES-970]
MFSRRRVQDYLLSSCFAFGSLGLGLVPEVTLKPSLVSWENQAIAQSQPSAADINRYAEAYLAIYGNNNMDNLLLEVERMIGRKPDWEIRCDQPQSINRLNHRAAIGKVRRYCNEVLPNLVDDIMPRRTFNSITNQLSNNPALQERVEDAMLNILRQRQRR